MDRRNVLRRAGMAAIAAWTGHLIPNAAQPVTLIPAEPILDAHIHLFDPTRTGGVPWPLPNDPIYKPSLPSFYEALARPLGIVGAIAIEASRLKADNDWLLNIVRSSDIMVGIIGDLPPSLSDFATDLDRLHREPLFVGIRHGNLWNRSLSEDLQNPLFWRNLQHLAASNLVFETANPDLVILGALVRLADRVPQLQIVIDHLPHMEQPVAAEDKQAVATYLREPAAAPKVSIKLSEIPQLANGSLRRDITFYQQHLDTLWTLFGEDRCLFGSDWPNSDHVASLHQTVSLVKKYMAEKSPTGRRKFFSENCQRIYGCKPRDANGQAQVPIARKLIPSSPSRRCLPDI